MAFDIRDRYRAVVYARNQQSRSGNLEQRVQSRSQVLRERGLNDLRR
jgi:hypothetical protein